MFSRYATLRLCAACVLSSAASRANTWYVDASAAPPGLGTLASPYTSIQYAHDQATTVDNDLLLVAPGTYVENVHLSKRITVQATGGAEVTTLQPAAAGPILVLDGPTDELDSLVFEGFRITGVFGPQNTAAVSSFDGKLLRCIVSGNRGDSYVGVATQYDTNVVDSTIAGNDYGIIQYNVGYTHLRNTILWNVRYDFSLVSGFIPDFQYSATGISSWGGTTNFAGNPGLCYGWTGDMHLRAGSPCIDAGDPTLPNDPDGSRGDIGYHAYDPLNACGPFTEFCPGDGSAAACPCSNTGIPGRGCDNSPPGNSGALLFAHGTTNPDTVVLQASGVLATSLTIFFQGNATLAPGVAFGDGLRCAGGTFKRMYVKNASGGAAHAPAVGDPSITVRSAAVGDPILSGHRRYYQAYYRDGSASFCPSPQGNSFNASSGVKVVW